MDELGRIGESIARLNKVLSAFNAPPIPLNLLTSALNNSKIVAELEKLAESRRVKSQIDNIVRKKGVPRNLAVLATVVELIEEGERDLKIVAEIIRG